MTTTPQGPLDEPVDAAGQDDTAAAADADRAPVSGSPAEADSDLGYSRGDAGESSEQAGQTGQTRDGGGTDYLDADGVTGPGDSGNI